MKVLLIEGELSSRELLACLLREKGHELFSFEEGEGALDLLQIRSFDLILSDLKGISLLEKSKRRPIGTPLIYLKGRKDAALPIEYVLKKPLHPEDILSLLFKIGGKQQQVVAESPAMKEILQKIEKIAKSHANVLIQGESGTGKEVVAGLIHSLSPRGGAPFIRVNCAALPDTLIESEFFGHEKGAFTGALQRRLGRFERADRGTLLLDEVSEIPPQLQAKLLRAVQEQEFERVGGSAPIHVDVRLISTSNRPLKEAILKGSFREDLYYRLNVVPLYLPPLRERKEDILPLAHHFLAQVCTKNGLPLKTVSKEGEKKLLSYDWPGNIRELRNVIEHGVVIAGDEPLKGSHFLIEEKEPSSPILTLKALEKEHILAVLSRCQGNRTRVAKALGITTRTLRTKLREYFGE
ncbi:MAG: sigma-54-dependent Fis family transcriptional regulator [Chlamydiia bacterium]|nr:sigma-54-dependent Fis family transcriptional regulator [Chlamydiia bacterium]